MSDVESSASAKELRGRTKQELESLLEQKYEDLHRLSFKRALRQLRETHQLKGVRHDIARISTLIREKVGEQSP